nr:hypothetical protein HJG63_009053 [Rousettus aegyptiacus]
MLKPRWRQGCAPSGGSKRRSLLPLPASGGCRRALACGHITPVCPHSPMCPVSSHLLPLSAKNFVDGCTERVHVIDLSLLSDMQDGTLVGIWGLGCQMFQVACCAWIVCTNCVIYAECLPFFWQSRILVHVRQSMPM